MKDLQGLLCSSVVTLQVALQELHTLLFIKTLEQFSTVKSLSQEKTKLKEIK